jgi:hypothetical protein
MRFVRVKAVSSDQGGKDATFRVTVVCAIDDKSQLVDGEWIGYVKGSLMLQRGTTLIYGGDDQDYEVTTLGNKPIQVGGYFTITDVAGEEFVFKITHCHEYLA